MAGRTTSIDGLADAVMDGLKEYASLTTDTVKDAVNASAKTVKKDIQTNAPKRTGRYKKSWRTKKTAETSNSLTVTVRGGGRVAGKEHIAPAEKNGEKELLQRIERGLSK